MALLLLPALVVLSVFAADAISTGAAKPKPVHHSGSGPNRVIPTPRGLLAITTPRTPGTMWALSGTAKAKTLTQIDLATGTMMTQISVSSAASDVTVLPNGVLALSTGTKSTGTVQLYNPTTKGLLVIRPVAGPVVALQYGGGKIYALEATPTARSVVVLNALSLATLQSIPVAKNAVSVLPPVPALGMPVLLSSGVLQEVSPLTSRVLAAFPTGGPALAMAASSNGQTLYVLRYLAHVSTVPGVGANVGVVDLATEQVRHALSAPAHCVDIVLSGSRLFDGVGTSSYGNIQIYVLSPPPATSATTSTSPP